MSAQAQFIKDLVNLYVRNYATAAFQDLRMNRILLMLADLADGGGGGGGGVSSIFVGVTSADFINATDCPITSMAGGTISVYWNEGNRYLLKDAGEWTDLPGGGFRVLMPGFDSTTSTYHFFVMLDGIGSQVLMVPVTSANFTSTTDCPISSLDGRNIAVFWNEGSRFLLQSAGEWSPLVGGGFKVLLAGFDSTAATYHFFAYVL